MLRRCAKMIKATKPRLAQKTYEAFGCSSATHNGTLPTAMIAVMETPSVQERLRDIGAVVVPPERRSPDYLAKFVMSEIEKWAVPIKASGISVE